MGRLTHPEGLRLGKMQNWKSRWQGNIGYNMKLHKDLGFEEYVERLLVSKGYQKSGLIYSHMYVSRLSSGIRVELYLYDGPWNTMKMQGDLELSDGLKKRLKLLGEQIEKSGRLFFNRNVDVVIYGIGSDWITAQTIAYYVGIKLKQGYGLEEVLSGIRRNLDKNSNILGYRIDCSGRYSRRQRASKRSLRNGRVPLNSLGVLIEYGFSKVILKYGVCGIKVWLHRKKDNRMAVGYVMKKRGIQVC